MESVIRKLVTQLVPEEQRAAYLAELDGVDTSAEDVTLTQTGYETSDGTRVVYDANGSAVTYKKDDRGNYKVVEAPEASEGDAYETFDDVEYVEVSDPADPAKAPGTEGR